MTVRSPGDAVPVRSYVGIHPTGRRYYAVSRTGHPLVFAVFARSRRPDWRGQPAKWKLAQLIEDRPYANQLHRVNGSYVPYEGDMPPAVKAATIVEWHHSVVEYDAQIVELYPADGSKRNRSAP